MNTLTSSRRTVKPTSPARSFADGLIDPETGRIARLMPYSAADLAWASQTFGETATDYDVLIPGPAPISGGAPTDADFDRMADESAALDRLERGLCL